MNDNQQQEEQFSDDPEENLRIENEILKLKLNAELGGTFEALTDIPAEVENRFLKSVFEFEKQQSDATMKTVYQSVGEPPFISAADLTDDELGDELERIEKIMENKGVVVDYLVEYPDRLKYTFITEELFPHEASFFAVPGMTTHYIYEEFHPNHTYDITHRAETFIDRFFDLAHEAFELGLADWFTTTGGTTLSKNEVLEKIKWAQDSYTSITNQGYTINNTWFQLDETTGKGEGTVDGTTSYDATLENGEMVHYEGAFHFRLTCTDNYWEIDLVDFPGLPM